MVREKSGNLRNNERKVWEKSGVSTGCHHVKVLPLLRLNLMISVFAKTLYQKVMENFLRSGKRKVEKKWPPCFRMLEEYDVRDFLVFMVSNRRESIKF